MLGFFLGKTHYKENLMAASKYDFSIEQGSSYQIVFIYKDTNKDPIDLNNWCARLTWQTDKGDKKTFSSEEVSVAEYTFDLNGNPGEIKLLIPATTTRAFDFAYANYDLELQSPDDFSNAGDKFVTRILYGTITLEERASSKNETNVCS